MDTRPDLHRSKRENNPSIDLSKLDRLPPHSLEAEQGVLGCILLSPVESIGVCQEKLSSSEAFYDLRHQALYDTVLDMFDQRKPIDLITLSDELKNSGQLEAVGGLAYISGLSDSVPSSANLAYYIEIVHQKEKLRSLLKTCTHLISKVHDHDGDPGSLVEEAERSILKIGDESNRSSEDKSTKQRAQAVIDRIQFFHQNKGKLSGLPTSLADLDYHTGGLQNGEMIVIAARPSVGKSALAMQITDAVCASGDAAAMFSLEMGDLSLDMRRVSSISGVSATAIRNGNISEADMKKLFAATKEINQRKLTIDERSGLTIGQIAAKCRRLHATQGIKLVVIDYLQLIAGSRSRKSDNRQQEVTEISAGVKGIAKDLNIPVIVLSQLSRAVVEKNGRTRKPVMSDLRESGAIEQDADTVILLHREPPEDETDYNPGIDNINANIAKNRNGEPGIDIKLLFRKNILRFEGVSRIQEPI